jgi:hypothetical protein
MTERPDLIPGTLTREHLIEHQFQDSGGGGTLLRRHHAHFVIDALPHCMRHGVWNLELRTGSGAFRHELQVETPEELEVLLRCIDRKSQPR